MAIHSLDAPARELGGAAWKRLRYGDQGALGLAIAAAVAAAASASAAVIGAAVMGEDPVALVRDPAALHDRSPLAGAVTSIGVFAMITAATVCLFAATLVRRDRALLLTVGLFSGYIAIDDFFMVHESLLPAVGIPEEVTIALIAVATIVILVVFRRAFLSRDALGAWVAVCLLAASVATDTISDYNDPLMILEEVLKFAGIAAWAAFWIMRAHAAVSHRPTSAETV